MRGTGSVPFHLICREWSPCRSAFFPMSESYFSSRGPVVRHLILRSFQSPGDVLMLTAAVRDLHAAAPGRYCTDVRTSCPALWDHNPHLTPLHEAAPGVE